MSKATHQIQRFVAENVLDDLQDLYWPGMSCFLFVSPEKSKRFPVKSKDYRVEETKNMSYLLNSMTRFGVSGWDYHNKTSHFLSIDVDLAGTKKIDGVTQERMDEIITACSGLPYLEVRKSTHGKGLLIRAFLQEGISSETNMEHKKLCKTLIQQINQDTKLELVLGKDVDKYGEIAWIWSSEQNEDSFALLSAHIDYYEPKEVESEATPRIFVDCDIQAVEEEGFWSSLTDKTKECLDWIKGKDGIVEYNVAQNEDKEDFGCIKLHTFMLQRAHAHFNLCGKFETVASGSNTRDVNCFAIPTTNGGLRVIRYGGGNEKGWMVDDKGRSFCMFNDALTLSATAHKFGGQLDPGNGYLFDSLTNAIKCLNTYTKEKVACPDIYKDRKAAIKLIDSSNIQVRVDKEYSQERAMADGWHNGRGYFKTTIQVHIPEDNDIGLTDEEIGLVKENTRHIVMHYNSANTMWQIKTRGAWVKKGASEVDPFITSFGFGNKAKAIRGMLMRESLFGIDVPFGKEILGKHTVNITKAKLNVEPEKVKDISTWWAFLLHIGSYLTPFIKQDLVCQELGIRDGKDYLVLWIALSIRKPALRLPYLFLFGEQETGKSMFHEVLGHLLSPSSFARGDRALTDAKAFNGDLMGATHIILEEVDFSANPLAYNRLKDYVTAEDISIRALYMDAMIMPNYTHWIQVANSASYCPVESKDTRVTMIKVSKPVNPRPKHELSDALKKEAPQFLQHLLSMDLPNFKGRLAMPVIKTDAKDEVTETRSNNVECYIEDCIVSKNGAFELLTDIYSNYVAYCKEIKGSNRTPLTRRAFSKEMQKSFPKGRSTKMSGKHIFGNMFLAEDPGGYQVDGILVPRASDPEWLDVAPVPKQGKSDE